jgi:folate-dependent phosphoribosylglycinamide formyltransferase PurN
MRLVLLTQNTQYARAIITMAACQNIKFSGIVFVKPSFKEKLRLVSAVLKRSGLLGLPYYLIQRDIQETHLKVKMDEYAYLTTDECLQRITYCKTVGFNSSETHQAVQTLRPDVLVLGQVGLLGHAMLSIPRYGTINGHTGLLPHYRGYTDPAHMILNNDHSQVGVSVHWVDGGVDTGEVISTWKYKAHHKPASLNQLLADLRFKAAKLLVETLRENQDYIPKRAPGRDSKLCFLLPISERNIAEKMYQELPSDCFSPACGTNRDVVPLSGTKADPHHNNKKQ